MKSNLALLQGRASAKKKWIEETLLSNSNTPSRSTWPTSQTLRSLSWSGAERREWSAKVSAADELEDEVRTWMEEKVHKKQLQMLATEEERQKELARHVIAEERKKHEEVLLIIQESRLLLEEVERLAIDKD